MTITGYARGSDGIALQSFSLQVKNPDNEVVLNQEFTNGQFITDAVPGYEYYFGGGINYGWVMMDGKDLYNGVSVSIPKNFDAPTASKSFQAIYLASGAALVLLLLNNKKKGVGKLETKDIVPWVVIGGVVIGFDLIKKMFGKLGIWDSPETKQLDNQATNPESYWNPNFYTRFSNYTYAIDTNKASQLAETIYNSFGAFNDCEECVKSVFYSLKTKSNVSFLVKIFNDKYGQDLLSFLRGGVWPQDRLSDTDVAEIDSFLSKLPNN